MIPDQILPHPFNKEVPYVPAEPVSSDVYTYRGPITIGDLRKGPRVYDSSININTESWKKHTAYAINNRMILIGSMQHTCPQCAGPANTYTYRYTHNTNATVTLTYSQCLHCAVEKLVNK